MTTNIDFLNQLNDSQRKAVEYCDGPSLVIAGAGSGKTRVLTYKIAYLVANGLNAWNILALTFTNKAADEMKQRIAQLIGEDTARYLHMGTFHSIFSKILRIEAENIGYNANFTIYDNLLVDGAQEGGQILCNVPQSGFTYESLLDGNLNTYFQSLDRGEELNRSSVYLEFDLRRDDISSLNFEFYGIANGYRNPNAIDVYVSKDASEDSWKRLIGFTEGFDTNKPNAHYVSPDIDLKDTYQYIRLYPTSSPTSSFNFNLAEIQFHPTTPNTEKSQYYYVTGLKEAADKLKDIIDRVQEKVDNGLAIDLSDTTAINEATAAVKALVINPAEYKTMAESASSTLTNPYNIGKNIGQYPESAAAALKAVLEQTNAMVNYDKPEREAFDNATKQLSEALKTFEESRNGVNTNMWYTIHYPNEDYYEYRGWTMPSWWSEINPLWGQYLIPGLRTEDAGMILSEGDVAMGDKVYFFNKDEADSEPDAAQWRFVEIEKGKYALQNRRSGLFIYSGTENNSSSMQLTPSTVRVEMVGNGQCALYIVHQRQQSHRSCFSCIQTGNGAADY